jgi:plastocyanin
MKNPASWSAVAARGYCAAVWVLLVCQPAFADGPAPAATVVIDNFSFDPPRLAITAGSTVTWRNRDDMPHTIVNDATPRAFRSPPLDSGEQFSWTFSKPGLTRTFAPCIRG